MVCSLVCRFVNSYIWTANATAKESFNVHNNYAQKLKKMELNMLTRICWIIVEFMFRWVKRYVSHTPNFKDDETFGGNRCEESRGPSLLRSPTRLVSAPHPRDRSSSQAIRRCWLVSLSLAWSVPSLHFKPESLMCAPSLFNFSLFSRINVIVSLSSLVSLHTLLEDRQESQCHQ